MILCFFSDGKFLSNLNEIDKSEQKASINGDRSAKGSGYGWPTDRSASSAGKHRNSTAQKFHIHICLFVFEWWNFLVPIIYWSGVCGDVFAVVLA